MGPQISGEGDHRIVGFFGNQTNIILIKLSPILYLSNATLLIHSFKGKRLTSPVCFVLHLYVCSTDTNSVPLLNLAPA